MIVNAERALLARAENAEKELSELNAKLQYLEAALKLRDKINSN